MMMNNLFSKPPFDEKKTSPLALIEKKLNFRCNLIYRLKIYYQQKEKIIHMISSSVINYNVYNEIRMVKIFWSIDSLYKYRVCWCYSIALPLQWYEKKKWYEMRTISMYTQRPSRKPSKVVCWCSLLPVGNFLSVVILVYYSLSCSWLVVRFKALLSNDLINIWLCAMDAVRHILFWWYDIRASIWIRSMCMYLCVCVCAQRKSFQVFRLEQLVAVIAAITPARAVDWNVKISTTDVCGPVFGVCCPEELSMR